MQAALAALGLLAPLSLLLSDLPLPAALPLGLLAMVAAGHRIGRERRAGAHQLLIPHGAAPATVDGRSVQALQLHCRGPLSVLCWRDGRRRRALLFWPDTLSRGQRRELRLALQSRRISQLPRQMAP